MSELPYASVSKQVFEETFYANMSLICMEIK